MMALVIFDSKALMILVIWLQSVISLFSRISFMVASSLMQVLACYSSFIVFRVASSHFAILNHQKFKIDSLQMKVMAKESEPLVILLIGNAWFQVYRLLQMSTDSFHLVQLY